MLLNDRQIASLNKEGLISPSFDKLINRKEDPITQEITKVLSYGLSSTGYDIRLSSDDFYLLSSPDLFTINDPKNFDTKLVYKQEVQKDETGKYFIIPPHTYALGVSVERFNLPNNVSGVAVGKSTYARCLAGDTEILTAEGVKTITEIMEDDEKGKVTIGFGVDLETDEVVAQPLLAARQTGIKKVLRYSTLKGDVRCTEDHLFLTVNKEWKTLEDLPRSEVLRSVYYGDSLGFPFIFDGNNNKGFNKKWIKRGFKSFNSLLCALYLGKESLYREYHTVKHKNGNLFDFSFDNLEVDYNAGDAEIDTALTVFKNQKRNIAQIKSYMRADLNDKLCLEALLATGTVSGAIELLQCDRGTFTRKLGDKIAALRYSVSNLGTSPTLKEKKHPVYTLTAPKTGNFVLANGLVSKNCGLIVNTTPLESGWEGHLTLEFSNPTNTTLKVYADEGICQIMFFQTDTCETDYKSRKGKYENQPEKVVFSRV